MALVVLKASRVSPERLELECENVRYASLFALRRADGGVYMAGDLCDDEYKGLRNRFINRLPASGFGEGKRDREDRAVELEFVDDAETILSLNCVLLLI